MDTSNIGVQSYSLPGADRRGERNARQQRHLLRQADSLQLPAGISVSGQGEEEDRTLQRKRDLDRLPATV